MNVTLETEFSETGQYEPWKNDVAKELNHLLRIAVRSTQHDLRDETYIPEEQALFSIVQRVAEFEEITVLKGEE